MNKSDVQNILDGVEESIVRVLDKANNGLPEQMELTLNDNGKSRKLVILVLEVESE